MITISFYLYLILEGTLKLLEREVVKITLMDLREMPDDTDISTQERGNFFDLLPNDEGGQKEDSRAAHANGWEDKSLQIVLPPDMSSQKQNML